MRPTEVVVTGTTNGRNSPALERSKSASEKERKLSGVSLPPERNPFVAGIEGCLFSSLDRILSLVREVIMVSFEGWGPPCVDSYSAVSLPARRILLDNLDEARNLRNSFLLDLPALEVPVSSIMPCVTFTTPASSLLASSPLVTLFSANVNHLPKNNIAAYCEATVAQAAPAAPPNILDPALGTSSTSPRKLTTAAASRTYNGDFTSRIPRHALCAVPMTTVAGMPRARMRTYRSAAPKTSGSRASFPIRNRSSVRPQAKSATPKADPTRRASLSATISVAVVLGREVARPPAKRTSSSSSLAAAAIRLVVAVYMNATRRAP
mmetsp:Transcript_54340/g.115404  ORF Transcript_54340/g.115404 Transcript_54340/m.115404 type:complete len:322 (+) Transcript_54340:229-1194(+)